MTVTSTTTSVERAGNGVAREFSFSPIKIFDETQLEVVVRDSSGALTTISRGTGSSAYAVVATFTEGQSSTGSIRYPEAGGTLLPTGSYISIRRVIPNLQDVNIENQGGYLPEVQEEMHDLHVMRVQQLAEEITRTVKVPFGSADLPEDYLGEAAASATAAAASAAAAEAAADIAVGAATPVINVRLDPYFATGDGTTDDTAAIQAALNDGSGKIVYFPKGTYSVSSLSVNNSQVNLRGESMGNTTIKARSAVSVLVTATNAAYVEHDNLTFDGNGLANTCLDTTFTTDAPSLVNRYSHLRFRNYLVQAWNATHNNDCVFDSILVEKGSTGTYSIYMPANGGHVIIDNCILYRELAINCQSAKISGCVLSGVTIIGNDDNDITISSGYWYGGPTTLNNLTINSSAFVRCLNVIGGRIENANSAGYIFGGTGSLDSGIHLHHVHVFRTGSATPTLVGSGIQNTTGGFKAPVILNGGWLHGSITATDTADVFISFRGTNVGGTPNYTQRVGGQNYTKLEPNNSVFGGDDSFGDISVCRTRTTASIASGTTATVSATNIPNSGIMVVQPHTSNFPGAVYAYTGIRSGTPNITQLSKQDESGGGTLTVAYTTTGATPSFTVSHNKATGSTFYKIAFFGVV